MVNQKEYTPIIGPKNEKKKRGVSFKILFSVLATLALSSGGYHLLRANNNRPQSVAAATATSLIRGDDGTNTNVIDAVISAPSVVVVATATTILVRGNNGDGDGEQEELSSTSVGDNFHDPYCVENHFNQQACEDAGCFWYPHGNRFRIFCSKFSGVRCGGHRASSCTDCPFYDGEKKRKRLLQRRMQMV